MPDKKNKNRTMSDEERLKRQSRISAGIGAGELLAGLGLKGLAISKGRKELAPVFQEIYKHLNPVFRGPLLYEQSPIYRKLNPWVRPLTAVGSARLISSLVAGHEARRRAKLKEEERKLTPEELVQAADSEIKRLANRKKLMKALATAGIISSIALPIVGGRKGVVKDLTPERQALLLRLKPHWAEPYLRRTSPTFARARMLGRGLGIAGLGALGAAGVYGAEELKRRRKKLEALKRRRKKLEAKDTLVSSDMSNS